jgi:hypothetical protein
MKPQDLKHILLMKAGPYCGYSLEEIIRIKQKEEQCIGKFFWGYGGVFCRPRVINAFVANAKKQAQQPKVVFALTSSAFLGNQVGRFKQYSYEDDAWEKLPNEVLLVGNTNKPHFAIVAKNLKAVDFQIDLGDYCSLTDGEADASKTLDTYFRYRVDKACAYYTPRQVPLEKWTNIRYIADLVEPYVVSVR